MEALKKQLNNELENYVKANNLEIETVFIGGGTPSTIKANEYKEVFDLIKPYLIENVEITTEANPNSASLQWQKEMFSHGVNRISFGVQSFNTEKLKFLGRSHNEQSAINAINNAKTVGFNGINCDIIYGVQGDTLESMKKDLDVAFSLPITHLSAYSLTIEEGTKFFDRSSVKIDDEELSYEIFDYIYKNGFNQYEISNFSRAKKYESKHNYGYWEHKEYLGIGAGAVGYYNHQRRYPNKNIEEYIQNPFDIEFEDINEDDVKTEKILLGFRSSNGVLLELFNDNEKVKLNDLIEHDKLFIKDNRVYNKNFLLSDELALYILG